MPLLTLAALSAVISGIKVLEVVKSYDTIILSSLCGVPSFITVIFTHDPYIYI